MPWKKLSKDQQRFECVRQMVAGKVSVSQLSRHFGISRQTAYKWRNRYRQNRHRGLRDKSRRPLCSGLQTDVVWLRRIRRFRKLKPTWGARKLRYKLIQKHPGGAAPSIATISRWLKRWGLSRGHPRRFRGPVIAQVAGHYPKKCHALWTVDFKGWYRTGNGVRVEPLTVRDLYSRYGLRIELLRSQEVAESRRCFQKIFKMHGLPQRIRCDNGAPFGGGGPTGLTRLSAWWIKLGIEVEFITPGRPCENGAHEQFHRVYKAEVAAKPERTPGAQQIRSTLWLHDYNHQRPHEGLGMKRPVDLFKKNLRRLPKRMEAWKYPKTWERCWVKGNGEICQDGVRRYVGQAFVRDYVGLRPIRKGVWWVYFGPALVGELRENERGRIRMAKYGRAR